MKNAIKVYKNIILLYIGTYIFTQIIIIILHQTDDRCQTAFMKSCNNNFSKAVFIFYLHGIKLSK